MREPYPGSNPLKERHMKRSIPLIAVSSVLPAGTLRGQAPVTGVAGRLLSIARGMTSR